MADNRLNPAQEALLGEYIEIMNNWYNIFSNDIHPTHAEFEMMDRLTYVLYMLQNCHTPNQFMECEYVFFEMDVQARQLLNSPPRAQQASHRR